MSLNKYARITNKENEEKVKVENQYNDSYEAEKLGTHRPKPEILEHD